MGKITFIGFMGSGKTSVGKKLSEKTGLPFVDLDLLIEKEEGRKIADLFKEEGEAYFRRLESEALKKALRREDDLILSTGGGILTTEENLSVIREGGFVVYLRIRPETVCERLKEDRTRPLLIGEDKEKKVKALLSVREEKYEEAADLILCADHEDPQSLADRVIDVLKEKSFGP